MVVETFITESAQYWVGLEQAMPARAQIIDNDSESVSVGRCFSVLQVQPRELQQLQWYVLSTLPPSSLSLQELAHSLPLALCAQ